MSLARTMSSDRTPSTGQYRAAMFAPSTLVTALLLFFYLWAFLFGVPWETTAVNPLFPKWFDPYWTTDDATQQLYPLHRVHHPHLFEDDLITTMMRSYLTPLHYGISYLITLLTHDPIMTGHWVMLLQLGASVAFVFLAVNAGAGPIPALFSVAWLIHTRHVIQRLTGGLPRGWAAPLMFAYLYFLITGRHRAVLATILVGCLLQPVAAFLIAVSYGLFLLWRLALPSTRATTIRPFIECAMAAPVFALITLSVVRMPEEIGSMVTYAQALVTPEFIRPHGRFPFVPLLPLWEEIRLYGFHAFEIRYINPGPFWRASVPWVVGIFGVLLATAALLRRRVVVPGEVITFGVGAALVYLLSREFAFHLYVPDRHLRFPFAIFFIVAFSIGFWRALHGVSRGWESHRFSDARWALGGLTVIALYLYANAGFGLKGSANFNYTPHKYGSYPLWARQFSDENALFVGHPTHMDPLQLFGMRRAFVTTETAHPFYSKYGPEMRRRLSLAFRAHFARDMREVLEICEPEGITHIVFARRLFYPETLAQQTYKEPHRALVHELVSRPWPEYAFRQLPRTVNMKRFPPLVYRDEESLVVDLRLFREFLDQNPDWTSSREE